MGLILAYRERTSQPAPGSDPGLDGDNPITQGISFVACAGQSFDIVRRTRAVATLSPLTASRFGPQAGTAWRVGAGATAGITYGSSYQPMVGNTFSCISLARPTSQAKIQTFWSQRAAAGGAAIAFAANAGSADYNTFAPHAGNVCVFARDSATNVQSGCDAAGAVSGKPVVYGCSFIGAGATSNPIFVDGVQAGGGAAGAGGLTYDTSTQESKVGGLAGYTAGAEYVFFDDVALVVIWRRYLLNSEHFSLARNPWQIFAKEPVLVWVPEPVAGGFFSRYYYDMLKAA